MKTPSQLIKALTAIVVTVAVCTAGHAQTTWTGGGGDGLWNNAANWDNLVPAQAVPAIIGAGTPVLYDSPMAAPSFGGLTLASPLTVNANGFNIDASGTAPLSLTAGGLLLINSGGVATITNSAGSTIGTDSGISVQGGTLIVTNNTGNFAFGLNGNNNGAGFTNSGGTVIFNQPFQLRSRFSRFIMTGGFLDLQAGGGIIETSNDNERQWLINGGTANLGAFSVSRTLHTAGNGFVISNGVVNATSLQIGNSASRASATVAGGILTNTGSFTINDRTNAATSGERRVFFYVRGGTVYSTYAAGIIVGNQSNAGVGTSAVMGGFLDINSGLLVAEGITLVKDTTLTNVHGTLTLGGTGQIYLGPVGLNGNVGVSGTSYTVTLSGGTLGAKSDYAIAANGTLSGVFTLKAADLNDVPHNVTHNGVWSGAGSLTKTGNGILTLNAANTYAGVTLVNEGTLAFGAGGSLANSPQIGLGSGATLDASALAGGYTLAASRTLFGFGSVLGNVSAASGSIVNPGSNTVTGTLTFGGSLTQTGGAITHFELSSNPSGPNNDLVVVSGDLNVSGVNTIEIVGGGAPGSIHPLIQYGGILNGTLANFTISGATGSLTNNTATKTIALVIASAVRLPTNVTWIGNASVNDWDVLNRTNWLNGNSLDYFVTGDTVLFDTTGAARPNVNIVGNVAPTAITVGAPTDYSFSGNGSITGTGGLTKTNSGTLVITTTNSYTGPTVISGGVVAVTTLANGGANSAIGSASSSAANLILNGGTLRYLGTTVATDRAATLNANGGTLDVTNTVTTLTLSGSLSGEGNLIKAGNGILTLGVANTYTNGTLINGGTLALGSAGAVGSSGITNNGSTLRLNGALVVDNIIEFNGNATLELSGVGAGNASLRGSWYGSGTVNINFLTQNALQTFTIGGQGANGGNMENFSGTVNFGTNSGTLRINNDNSTFNFGSSNAIFDLGTGTGTLLQRNGGTTTHLGALIGGLETRLAGRGNTGASGVTTYSIGGRNLSTVFAGTITNGGNGTSATDIIKVGSGTLTLSGTNAYTGNTFVQYGALAIDGNNGPSPITVSGGTLKGGGVIGGPVIIQFDATLSPGSPVGALTINNTLQLDSGSFTVIDLNKAAGTNDSVVGLTFISYGGTLNVTNVGGAFAINDTFVLFNSIGGYSGQFEAINLPPLSNGLGWDTSNLLVDGSIKVVGIVLPELSIRATGGNLILSGTNGTAGATYKVLTSTNLALPLASWTAIETNVFDVNGTFSVTNAIDSATKQRFFILFVP